MKNDRDNRQPGTMPAITLRDALTPIFRHRRIMIVSFCCIFGVATVAAWAWAARYYKATMQVVEEQDRSDPAITTAQVANVNNDKAITLDQVASEVALLQGEDMLRNVVRSCQLVEDSWSATDILLPSDKQQRMAVKQELATRSLAKKIKVEAATTSDVIDVSYGRVGEPEKPACVLQTLGKLYLEKHLQLQHPAGSSDFFAQETEKYRRALEDSEKQLMEFSRREKVAAPDMLRTDMAQQLAVSEASLYQAQQAIAADRRRIENVRAQMAGTPARRQATWAASSEKSRPTTLGTPRSASIWRNKPPPQPTSSTRPVSSDSRRARSTNLR